MGDFFEKYLRFGLVLGQLAILKNKFWADYEQLLRAFFMSSEAKKIDNIIASVL